MLRVRIESTSRWDALALANRLGRYDWYLVEPDSRHWDICVSLPSDKGLPEDLRETIASWLHERKPEASIHLNDHAITL